MTTLADRAPAQPGPASAPALLRRMVSTGLPTLVASAVLVFLPLTGRLALSAPEYATWALVSTVVTISLVIDFGAPAHLLRASAHGTFGARAVQQAVLLTVAGSLAVGVAGAALWPWYSAGRDLALAGSSGAVLVACAGAATALRGVVVVLAAALIAAGRQVERGALLLGQALLQLALTVGLLHAGAGVPSLVLGAAASSVPAIAWLAVSLHRTPPVRRPGAEPLRGVTGFAATKGVVTVVSLTLTQLDRWVVGAVATPHVLSDYDTAARLAGLPRVLVVALSVVLVADATTAGSTAALRVLLARATRVCAQVVLAGSAAVLVLAAVLHAVPGAAVLVGPWPLLLAMLAWFGLHALTAPTTLVATGVGRPQLELRYLLPCFATTVLLWAAGLATGSTLTVVLGSGVPLAAFSAWFCLAGPGMLAGGAHRAR